MKLQILTRVVVLLAAIVVGAATTMVSAQTSITIAPARSDIARAIKAALRADREAGKPDAQAIYFAYGERGFEPIWLTPGAAGSAWSVSPRAKSLEGLFAAAADLGLEPAEYRLDLPQSIDETSAVAAELSITSVALRFGLDNYRGRLDPRAISDNLDMPRPVPAFGALANQLATSDDPAAVLAALAPQEPEFAAMLDALKASRDETELAAVAEGPSIKPGTSDPRIADVRRRLDQPPVGGDADQVYDEPLVEAVKSFQSSVGLTDDGVIGNATREALNRRGRIPRDLLLANLEKWRWLPRDRGAYRVEVNIPEYRLWVRRNDKIVYETRVVVGKPQNQTPVFYDQIRFAVVNPYWNVPSSIIRDEIGPAVKRDPGYLARGEYELLRDGQVIDPYAVDWSQVDPARFPFAVRQQPGKKNALGQVKFLFPNKHDVYLHDTPEKSLFGKEARAFSHGCVRVQNPFDFAGVLLADEPKFGSDDLVAAFGPSEKWFSMQVKVPVYLTYFTVRADTNGKLTSYADVYGHDRAIIAALRGEAL